MDKRDIERLMARRVREAAEEGAARCIAELNAAGHAFVAMEGPLPRWRDQDGQVLQVFHGSMVSLVPESQLLPAATPDPVVEAFMRLAESGQDPVADLLNRLEGDIANGGFAQLFVNKDRAFVRRAIRHLERIGAVQAARLVAEALEQVEEGKAALREHDKLSKALGRLDARFGRLRESIAALYMRSRGGNDSRDAPTKPARVSSSRARGTAGAASPRARRKRRS